MFPKRELPKLGLKKPADSMTNRRVHPAFFHFTKDIYMTLSKYDEKALSVVLPHIEAIQYFVDENIQSGNAMTAAAICEGFSEASGLEFDTEDFVKGLRVAIRIEKISGLESAKRAGYRRKGDSITSASEVVLEMFAPYIESIQKFADENLTTYMSSSAIYERFSKENECDLSEDDFKKGFKLALKEDLIEGVLSFRGKGKGYILASSVEDQTGEPVEDEHDLCEIFLSNNRKIVALDRFNWTYQVFKGSSWHVEGYYPNIRACVHALSIKIIDNELKQLDNFNAKEICNKIDESVNRIADILMNILPKEESKAA